MDLKTRAKYEGIKAARSLQGKETPGIYVIDQLLWKLFFDDKSVQNRILKER